MAKAKAPLKVPVSLSRGGFYHDTDYKRGAITREEAQRVFDEIAAKDGEEKARAWGVSYVMEEFPAFEARLRFDGYHKYGSSVYVMWVDAEGREFPMFIVDLSAFLSDGDMTMGLTEKLWWEPVKRGTAYGIKRRNQ